MSLVDVERLREIAEVEFADIVVEAWVPDLNELRVILTDSSFMVLYQGVCYAEAEVLYPVDSRCGAGLSLNGHP